METMIATTPVIKPRPFPVAQAKLMKHSPEILVVTGIVGTVAGTILACRATLKAPAIIEAHKEMIADINEATEIVGDYEVIDRRKDLVTAYGRTAVSLIKLYGLPALIMGSSYFMIGKGHNITVKRNAGLTAALSGVSSAYAEYRNHIAEVYGSDVEEDLYKGREIETKAKEDGKTVKRVVKAIEYPNKHSAYARFFDDTSPHWQPTPELSLFFLRTTQSYANDLLKVRGHVFLNEVYDMLGLSRSSSGAVIGWVISKDGDNFVDFGLYDKDDERSRAFINGDEQNVLLDFNVDGVIVDKI